MGEAVPLRVHDLCPRCHRDYGHGRSYLSVMNTYTPPFIDTPKRLSTAASSLPAFAFAYPRNHAFLLLSVIPSFGQGPSHHLISRTLIRQSHTYQYLDSMY